MSTNTKPTYYVLQKGSVQEEAWEWADIEAMCRSGRLSADSLVFLPQENDWKRVADTELAKYFEDGAPPAEETPEAIDTADLEAEYEKLSEEFRFGPVQWNACLEAAGLALQLGRRADACRHFQRALDGYPYHPRVVQEAKRNLSPAERKSLRFLDRPAPFWESVDTMLRYPVMSGPLYVAIPSVILAALLWVPHATVGVVLFLYLWLTQVITASCREMKKPPLWQGIRMEPRRALVNPLVVGISYGVGIFLPIVGVAYLVTSFGGAEQTMSVLTWIRKSPVTTVLLFTVSMFLFPAIAVIASTTGMSTRQALNPKFIFSIIATMEIEYMASIACLLLLAGLWGLSRWMFGWIPFAGSLLWMTVGIYAMLVGGFMLGRLQARYRDQMASRATNGTSSIQELPNAED